MALLIRNLLDMSRFEGGGVQLDLDWQSLEELVGSAIVRTEKLLARELRASIPSDLPLLRLDGILMEQALINLIENAARHGGRNAQILISARREGQSVILTVADDGPGFAPGQEEEIFEKFRRGGASGFGLGLAICRAVVTAHGGTIRAENIAPTGAQFTIELPISEEASRG